VDFFLYLVVAAVLVWAGAGVKAELGKDRLPLETLIPADTLVFLTLPDIGKAKEDWKGTALYKIWNDPEVQHAVDTLLGNVDEYKKEFEEGFLKETGVEFEKALEIFSGQLSLALIALPDPKDEGPPIPKAAMALDFGEHRAEVEKLLGWVVKQMKEGNPGTEETTWESEGTKVSVLGDEEMRFHWVLAGPTLLVSTHKDVMEGMLKRARGADAATLSGNETFKKVLAEVAPSGSPSLLVYANIPGWIATLETMMSEDEEALAETKKILDVTGARGLQAAAVSVTVGANGVQDRIYLHAPGPREGVMKILTPGVTTAPSLPLVPADAMSFSAMRFDLAKAWDQGLEILKQVNEDAWKEVTEEIANFEKEAGALIRTDLLGSLGKELGSWSAFPEKGGVLPYTVTTVALKDPVAFEASVERLYKALGMQRRELQWMGQKICYFVAGMTPEEDPAMPGHPGPRGIEGPIPGLGSPEMMMLNLTSFSAYFIDGGTLYTSNLVQTLKEMLRKRGAGGGKGLAQSAEFQKLQSKLPENCGIIMYFDLKDSFYLIYNSLLPIAQYAEVFLRRTLGVPFETASLPTAEAIGGHLAPSITGIADRPGGVLISSYSTTGVTAASFLGVAGAGMAAAILVPTLMRSKVGANETSALATLKMISTGQEQFKNAVCVDVNVNGVGEYGFLQELAGTSPCRTAGGLDGPTNAAAPFIPRIMGMTDVQGRVMKSGYYFKLYLPGKEQAVSAGARVPAGDAGLAAARETRYCVYAWPIEFGRTGYRAFFIDMQGQPYSTSSPAYSGEMSPAPGAAYSSKSEKANNLDGPVDSNEPASDGNFWFPTG